MSNHSQGNRANTAQPAKRRLLLIFIALASLMVAVVVLLSACRPELLDPPRLATQSAEVIVLPSPSFTPVYSSAHTPTAQLSDSRAAAISSENDASRDQITLWVNETSPAHARALEEMVEDFTTEQEILVEVVLISPQLLPQLVQQAVISDTLPDLIIHPITYSPGWMKQGILDANLATEATQEIGEATFNQEALRAVQRDDGLFAAVPSDGWQQLLVYREDWFADLNLARPDNYNDLLVAAEAIYEPEGTVTGIVVPTDASLVATQQVFEYLAVTNGCELVEQGGRVILLHPACLEALEFYRELINSYSPIGFQTEVSSLNAYLDGRTGMIVATPAILPYLAGLNEQNQPECPDCLEPDYLAKNSGFVTRLGGGPQSEGTASFSELTALGFTSGADSESTLAFAEYWFNEGYSKWLMVNPERKVPLRTGTLDQPGLFIDNWANSPILVNGPTLSEAFGSGLVSQLTEDIASSDRWGFDVGQGEMVSLLYQEQLMSPLLQDMLSGYFTSSETIVEMYQVMVKAIPFYSFPIEVSSTPSP